MIFLLPLMKSFVIGSLLKGVIFMPKVKLKDGDNLEYALRRFKKNCEKLGILSEIKNREAFEKPSLARKKKSIMARKRASRKTRYFS